jgi:DMSO/TMAO reductase YedYZ molybdopterin-dependent catalytic subunit
MTDRRRTLAIGFVSGAIGGVFMVLLMLVLRYFTGATSLPELILDRGAPFMPIPVFFRLLGLFGGYSQLKEIGVVSTLFALIAFAGAVGAAYAVKIRRARSHDGQSESTGPSYRSGMRFLILILSITWMLSVSLLWPVLVGNFKGLPTGQAFAFNILCLLAIYLLCGAVLVVLHHALASKSGATDSRGRLLNRRMILTGLLAGIGIAGVVSVLKKFYGFAAYGYDGTEETGTDLPPITPNKDFYVVTKNSVDPQPDRCLWRLEVTGSVKNPKTYRFDELAAMPSASQETTLECISNQVGSGLISNAIWKGVPLHQLIQASGPNANVVQVVFHGADAYSDDVSTEIAMLPTTLIAYEMNGEPLPLRHGFPARMIVPGMVGEKSVKWLTRIELRDTEAKQFYERQGWGPVFVVNTTSRFDAPDFSEPVDFATPIELRGMAFGGARGIQRVEVSTDDGLSWSRAELTYQSSPLAWVQWRFEWRPKVPGTYKLVVRAVDGTGGIQSGEDESSGPEPATGYHRVTATLKS